MGHWACRCNAASSNFSQLGNALCLCPGPPKMCLSAAPRAQPLILQSKPSIFFSSSLQESGDCHITCWGLNLDSKLNSAAWLTSFKFYLLRNPWISFAEFEFFQGPSKMPKLRQALSCWQPSSPSMPKYPSIWMQPRGLKSASTHQFH